MSEDNVNTASVVCTIGHSTHPIEEFIGLLHAHEVRHVLDVRTLPRSRHNPQFNQASLALSLRQAGIACTHLPGLGGLRQPAPDSINQGWRNTSFRGYADYMQTAEFAAHLEKAIALAARQRCALMCAEAAPWRCHRSLIADALMIRAIPVEHIIGQHERKPHQLTSFACVDQLTLTYPAEQLSLLG